MAWDHLSITKPHLVYIILGGFTSLFMLCSSVIKERLYIGEATVATLVGVIFGPHAANLIDPNSWGNVDEVTIEFSRIVLVVQCFAVGVELPKYYMERHWKSVIFLLLPVMTFGWLITSLIIWWLFPLNYLESLTVAACVTATDPVLASSVVGKGKFAKRVPKHLRDLLSAESGCNDGMAFPFVYLALYLIQDNLSPRETTFHWFVYTILYECIFGAVYGFAVGYIARHGIKYAERNDLIDRESFLVFYFVLALFCAGSGSILGIDDLLVGFAAGVGFSNDGWFHGKTEESHVSNVIDLLINLAYFVFLGTIIPWEMYNNFDIGLSAWRLSVMSIFVILFRRIPIMLMLKPIIPDVKTWHEALFAGHFGPIGVGAIFVAILARAELEDGDTIPLAMIPPEGHKNYQVILLVWPIVTFMVISSILIHGSSIAVFTLGKHINTLSITMSYTTAPEDGPAWMSRLPRISSQSRSQARTASETDFDDLKSPTFPPGALPPTGIAGQFLRRQREEEIMHNRSGSRTSSVVGRRRKKGWVDGVGPGGPVTQSAIAPQRRSTSDQPELLSPLDVEKGGRVSPRESSSSSSPVETVQETDPERREEHTPGEQHKESDSPRFEVYDERDNIVIEDQEGRVIAVEPTVQHMSMPDLENLKERVKEEVHKPGWTYDSLKKSFARWRNEEAQKRREKSKVELKHEPARAYQFGKTIIVENEHGEVVKKYDLPDEPSDGSKDYVASSLKYMGGLMKSTDKAKSRKSPQEITKVPKSGSAGAARNANEDDDRGFRFTISGAGKRLNKEDFLKEVQKLERSTREAADKLVVKEDANDTMATQVLKPSGETGELNTEQANKSNEGKSSLSRPVTPTRGRSVLKSTKDALDVDTAETSVERRRRLAAFASVEDDAHDDRNDRNDMNVNEGNGSSNNSNENNENETPAERRRREAALGVTNRSSGEVDSDDDDTVRIPPERRGIRFAEGPARRA
ncbi:alkali metal cation/H+ antiporter Nha1 C terminus-domain-containing protein [Xylaria sp. CBS 124048]|nr:alkali metal cation/H+ antiporter Nha1 C terminus-domain-containing protein [Xylaria sp. CBS 124048]